jgi:hypothetical protein
MELSLRVDSPTFILDSFLKLLISSESPFAHIPDKKLYIKSLLKRARQRKQKKQKQKEKEMTKEEREELHQLYLKQMETYQNLLRRIDYWNDRVYSRRTRYGISPSFIPSNVFEKILCQYCSVKWNWEIQSINPFITAEFIGNHPDKEWNWGQDGLSKHPTVTPEFVLEFKRKPWCFGEGGLSMNPSMTLNFILKYPRLPWHWGRLGLSMNPIVSPEFIMSHPELPWHWGDYGISINPSMTLEFIREHLDKPLEWGAGGLSCNPYIHLEFVLEFIDKPWCWKCLSFHKNITVKHIREHPELPWDITEVMKNQNFTLKDFYETPEYYEITDTTGLIANLSLPFPEAEEQLDEAIKLYQDTRPDIVTILFEKMCTRNDLPRKFIQKHSKIIVKKLYQDSFVVTDAFNVFYSRNYLSL